MASGCSMELEVSLLRSLCVSLREIRVFALWEAELRELSVRHSGLDRWWRQWVQLGIFFSSSAFRLLI